MSMAPTTEHQSSKTDLGHRLYVLGVFAVFFAEVALIVVNLGEGFGWLVALPGIVSSVLLLWLGNWLYTGNRQALSLMRFFVFVELCLCLAALISLGGSAVVAKYLGMTAMWQVDLKLFVYIVFSVLLMLSATLGFLSARRGESAATVATVTPEEMAAAGSPVDLGTEQTKTLENLEQAMTLFACVAWTLAIVLLVIEVVNRGDGQSNILLYAAVVGTIILLLQPVRPLHILLRASPCNMGHVMNVLSAFATTWKGYVIVLLVLVLALLVRALGDS